MGPSVCLLLFQVLPRDVHACRQADAAVVADASPGGGGGQVNSFNEDVCKCDPKDSAAVNNARCALEGILRVPVAAERGAAVVRARRILQGLGLDGALPPAVDTDLHWFQREHERVLERFTRMDAVLYAEAGKLFRYRVHNAEMRGVHRARPHVRRAAAQVSDCGPSPRCDAMGRDGIGWDGGARHVSDQLSPACERPLSPTQLRGKTYQKCKV
eukprot:scaffold562_cov235-Prasinococcus_capsulatus_cf.AAC.2